MKKITLKLGIAFVIICQLASVSSVALADALPEVPVAPATSPTATTTPTPEAASKPVELSPELNLFMEVLFVQLKAKAYEKAYAASATDFKKNMSLDEFTKFANAARLVDFTNKKWMDKQWDPKTGLIRLRGEFTADKLSSVGDKETHLVTFEMMKKGDTYEILGITETLSIALLGELFPKDTALQAMAQKDLSAIAKMAKGSNYRKFYATMSKKAHQNIKYSAFQKAMRAFKKEKKSISLASDTKITIDDGFPTINKDNGDVTVKGEYATGTYVVLFTLGYNYEWEWKLNSLNMNPVLPGEAAGARAAAKKAAQDAKR